LKKSRETDVIFDWDEFMTFDGNSGPYIQYAYVRARKILEKTHPLTPSLVRRGGNPECFESEQEIELLKQIIDYPNVLKKTLATNMPHHLCSYTYDLTKKFSSFYDKVHILNEADENKKNLRLALTDMFSNILKESFAILGIDMPEKM
jgi:arginyl-tRNA synthetase